MIPSNALEGFQDRLDEIEVLLKLVEAGKQKPKNPARNIKKQEAICRASIVLLCSHVEGFFESLVENVLRFHEMNCTSIGSLPVRMRLLHFNKNILELNNGAEPKKWKSVLEIRNNPLADESKACGVGMLNLDNLIRGFALPGSKEVDRLMKGIGISNVWTLIEAKTDSKILKGSLDSLVNRRHPIAHGDSSAKATPKDIRQLLEDMKLLAQTFDFVVTEQVATNYFNLDPWNIFQKQG